MNKNANERSYAYSSRELVRAVNVSAFGGWLLVNFVLIAGIAGWTFAGLGGFMMWSAIIGLPIAFVVSWLVIEPILIFAMRAPLTWPRSLAWGSAITLILAALIVALGHFVGLNRSVTSISWWIQAGQAAIFFVGGNLIALIVRFIIGPGQRY